MNALPLLTVIVLHAMVAYLLFVSPVRSRRRIQQAERDMAAGSTTARIGLYRDLIASQGIIVAVLLGLVAWGGVPAAGVGLGAPYSWPATLIETAVLTGLLVWSGVSMRKKAVKVREGLRNRASAMIPSTERERRYFAVVSVGSGPTEELLCRGFMFYFVRLWLPHLDMASVLLLTSAAFGFAHLYQGWKGILMTGIGGALLGVLYLASGNLLLPMVVHSLGNLRVAFLPAEAARGKCATPPAPAQPLEPAQTPPTARLS